MTNNNTRPPIKIRRRTLLKTLLAGSATAGATALEAGEPPQGSALPGARAIERHKPGTLTFLTGLEDATRASVAMHWAAAAAERTGRDAWFIWRHAEVEAMRDLLPPHLRVVRSRWTETPNALPQDQPTEFIAAAAHKTGRLLLQGNRDWCSPIKTLLREPECIGIKKPALIVFDVQRLNWGYEVNNRYNEWTPGYVIDVWDQIETHVGELLIASRRHDVPIVLVGQLPHRVNFDTGRLLRQVRIAPGCVTPGGSLGRYCDRMISAQRTDYPSAAAEQAGGFDPNYIADGTQTLLRVEYDRSRHNLGDLATTELMLRYDRGTRRYSELS